MTSTPVIVTPVIVTSTIMPVDHASISRATPVPVILQLVTGLQVGGAERVVLNLARGLARSEFKVIVVALNDERGLLDIIDTTGLDVRFLSMPKSAHGFIAAAKALAGIIATEDVRLIHAHLAHALMLATALKLRMTLDPTNRRRRPGLVFTSHSYAGFTGGWRTFIRATRRFRDADVLLAPDQHPGFNARDSVLIPNGVGSCAYRAKPAGRDVDATREGPALLSIGRLSEPKNFGALIDAFDRWVRAGAPQTASLRIAGEGPLRGDLQRQIDRLGLGARVRLLGLRDDIAALLASADAFVMSSHFEGLPLVALEAGAAGVPVIAPAVGGLPWLLGDGCGRLVSPVDLPDAFARLAVDPASFQADAERLHRKVRDSFSIESCVDAHIALYRRLTSGVTSPVKAFAS